MKRTILSILMICALLLTGCSALSTAPATSGENDAPASLTSFEGNDVPASLAASGEQNSPGNTATVPGGNDDLPESLPDDDYEEDELPSYLDFTGLNSAQQYEEALKIQFNFPSYLGKTVKAYGQFIYREGYPFLSIYDNINCCNTWFELIYDEGFPPENSFVTVEGLIDVYEEDGRQFPCFRVSEILTDET